MLKRPCAAVAVAGVVLAGCGGSQQPPPQRTATCGADDLRGSFTVVRGSAGAGQIVYRLRLENVSDGRCFVARPKLSLLGAGGQELPTSVIGDPIGSEPFPRVELAPGASAAATARFSPDVPGVGEGTIGRCEPVASRLRVRLSEGALAVPIRPPTSVCEHGRLAFRQLG